MDLTNASFSLRLSPGKGDMDMLFDEDFGTDAQDDTSFAFPSAKSPEKGKVKPNTIKSIKESRLPTITRRSEVDDTAKNYAVTPMTTTRRTPLRHVQSSRGDVIAQTLTPGRFESLKESVEELIQEDEEEESIEIPTPTHQDGLLAGNTTNLILQQMIPDDTFSFEHNTEDLSETGQPILDLEVPAVSREQDISSQSYSPINHFEQDGVTATLEETSGGVEVDDTPSFSVEDDHDSFTDPVISHSDSAEISSPNVLSQVEVMDPNATPEAPMSFVSPPSPDHGTPVEQPPPFEGIAPTATITPTLEEPKCDRPLRLSDISPRKNPTGMDETRTSATTSTKRPFNTDEEEGVTRKRSRGPTDSSSSDEPKPKKATRTKPVSVARREPVHRGSKKPVSSKVSQPRKPNSSATSERGGMDEKKASGSSTRKVGVESVSSTSRRHQALHSGGSMKRSTTVPSIVTHPKEKRVELKKSVDVSKPVPWKTRQQVGDSCSGKVKEDEVANAEMEHLHKQEDTHVQMLSVLPSELAVDLSNDDEPCSSARPSTSTSRQFPMQKYSTTTRRTKPPSASTSSTTTTKTTTLASSAPTPFTFKSSRHAVPDFKALHASLAMKKPAKKLTKPKSPPKNLQGRLRERAEFDKKVKEAEHERDLVKEEERKMREEEEEKEAKIERKRRVVKAHDVPDWYKDAPKRDRK